MFLFHRTVCQGLFLNILILFLRQETASFRWRNSRNIRLIGVKCLDFRLILSTKIRKLLNTFKHAAASNINRQSRQPVENHSTLGAAVSVINYYQFGIIEVVLIFDCHKRTCGD
jgi:hypothetical protein